MGDNNMKLNMYKILCQICNEINKIKIISNMDKKSISVSFICNHERNKKGLENVDYCLNCRKNLEKNGECIKNNHEIIKKVNLSFYCKAHKKKYSGYCNECKKNLCDECICNHIDIKSSCEYYFSLFQVNEILSVFDEVKNYINMIYSLDCNEQISKEFEDYYNWYIYLYNNDLFHVNIIYNINLFYNFFKFLIQNKFKINGDFSVSEINNVYDETVFYDTDFKNQFAYLLDMNSFNFKNVLDLFLLSKRFKIKPELFESFSNKINLYISYDILELNDVEKNINEFNNYFNEYKEEINMKKVEILKIQNEINYKILSIKLDKTVNPSSFKGKLIKILQREIMKKYKDNLHKIKSNDFILNNIKKRYESFKKQKKDVYEQLRLDIKFEDINSKKPETKDNFIDKVYFEKDFEYKCLLNTFLFFTQKLSYQKKNETHFSNKTTINSLSLNHLNTEILNNANKIKFKDNITLNNNLNNFGKNKDVNNGSNNQNIHLNNNFLINQPENESTLIEEHKNFLNNIKRKLNNSYQNKLVKNRLSLRDIIDALLINDFSNIIEITEENQNTEINNIINECLDELANIPIIEEETQKILKNIYFFN